MTTTLCNHSHSALLQRLLYFILGLHGAIPLTGTGSGSRDWCLSCSPGTKCSGKTTHVHVFYSIPPTGWPLICLPSLCKIQISLAGTTESQQKGETQGTAPWKELQWFSSLCSALCSATVMAFNYNAIPLPRSHTKSSFSITLNSTYCLAKAFRLRDQVLTCIVALPWNTLVKWCCYWGIFLLPPSPFSFLKRSKISKLQDEHLARRINVFVSHKYHLSKNITLFLFLQIHIHIYQ